MDHGIDLKTSMAREITKGLVNVKIYGVSLTLSKGDRFD